MKKPTKRDIVNLFFSSFLVIGYAICAYFFSTLLGNMVDPVTSGAVNLAIFAVFGLLLFYATRVGDGKQVRRFSIPTLILVDLPAIYILVAYFAMGLPFHTELAANTSIVLLAAVALGYAIPYTFLSGYELVPAEEEAPKAAEEQAEDGYSTLDIAFESEEEAQNAEDLEEKDEEIPTTAEAQAEKTAEAVKETEEKEKE